VGHALVVWLVALVISQLVLGSMIAALDLSTDNEEWPLWFIAVAFVPLGFGLVCGSILVSRRWGTGDVRKDYRFRFRPIDVLGLPLGAVFQLVFVPLLYRALWFIDPDQVDDEARALTDQASDAVGVLLLIVLVVVLAPIVEELFFRGLLMRALQARVNDALAIVVSAVLFALAHFQTVQFPALVMFGLIAGVIAQRVGRLGPSICFHAGFNLATVVVLTDLVG
jgi:uncharacterized protein